MRGRPGGAGIGPARDGGRLWGSDGPRRGDRRRPHGLRGALSALSVVLLAFLLVGTQALPASADTVRDMQYWLGDYGFTTAWETTKGAGVTVAVIDTGIASGPAELTGAVAGGVDVSGLGSPDGRTPVGSEGSEHGTLVASMIAGRGRTGGAGVIGVAPEARLLSVSVGFGSDGSAVVPWDDQIATAVRWAVDNGADVINMSLTRNSLDWPTSWDDAFLYAFSHDVVVVAAAGNRGSGTVEVGAPATIPGVLTVAGVDRAGSASFDASSQGITIAVAAPSEQLVGVTPAGSYVQWQGTSGAAPIVSGLVALVRSAWPELSAADAIKRVTATAKQVGDSAQSPIYGAGLIDAAKAVSGSVGPAATSPEQQLSDWITLYRRAPQVPDPDPGAEQPSPTPEPVPPAIPENEAVEVRANPFLPTPSTLLYGSLPLALLLGTGSLVTLGVIGATRHFKRVLQK
ncbi:S8 family serine peptidase [Plantibacter sp. CFBP 8775]|nr:S8 family serine peptidase [Plantibacter sp. CFBP 8775]MBD8535077.1 S8 family serine peptidase [Plantibacter sp. CFBP 13570]